MSTILAKGYNPVSEGFHKQDSCKDAIQAIERVTKPGKNEVSLFTRCMNIIYTTNEKSGTKLDEWVCGGGGTIRAFSRVLEEIEEKLKVDLQVDLQTSRALIKQINRLDTPAGYGQEQVLDNKLPTNITKAIRDSGGAPQSFYKDITILFVPSDITDPASRISYDDTKMQLYPNTPITLDNDFFTRLQGFSDEKKSVIHSFSASFYDRKGCTIEFTLKFDYNEKEYNKTFSTCVLLNDFTKDSRYVLPAGHLDAFEFFNKKVDPNEPPPLDPNIKQSGNPKKNKFFNRIGTRPSYTDNELLRGVAYIICKEFLGDIMIALIAYHYKTCNNPGAAGGAVANPPPANDYAVFTGDNALTAVCRNIKVNHVSTNHASKRKDKNKLDQITLECTAVVYSNNPAFIKEETETNKKIFKNDIKKFNQRVIHSIVKVINKNNGTHIFTGKSSQAITTLNENIKNFLRKIQEEIIYINNLVEVISITGGETFEIFQKNCKNYKVKDIIQDEGPASASIRFLKGVTNPFFLVPHNKTVIKNEFVKYLPRIIPGGDKINKIITDMNFCSPAEAATAAAAAALARATAAAAAAAAVAAPGAAPGANAAAAAAAEAEAEAEAAEAAEAAPGAAATAEGGAYKKYTKKPHDSHLTRVGVKIRSKHNKTRRHIIIGATFAESLEGKRLTFIENIDDETKLYKPTVMLKKLIENNLHSNYDTESIYSYLYFLFDITCQISYDNDVLKILIDDIISEKIQRYTKEQWISYYNYLMEHGKRKEVSEAEKKAEKAAEKAAEEEVKNLKEAAKAEAAKALAAKLEAAKAREVAAAKARKATAAAAMRERAEREHAAVAAAEAAKVAALSPRTLPRPTQGFRTHNQGNGISRKLFHSSADTSSLFTMPRVSASQPPVLHLHPSGAAGQFAAPSFSRPPQASSSLSSYSSSSSAAAASSLPWRFVPLPHAGVPSPLKRNSPQPPNEAAAAAEPSAKRSYVNIFHEEIAAARAAEAARVAAATIRRAAKSEAAAQMANKAAAQKQERQAAAAKRRAMERAAAPQAAAEVRRNSKNPRSRSRSRSRPREKKWPPINNTQRQKNRKIVRDNSFNLQSQPRGGRRKTQRKKLRGRRLTRRA